VRTLGRSGAPDTSVWEIARTGGLLLMTRDEDFVGMSVLRGSPPKVVSLNVGNARNAFFAALIRARATTSSAFRFTMNTRSWQSEGSTTQPPRIDGRPRLPFQHARTQKLLLKAQVRESGHSIDAGSHREWNSPFLFRE